MQKSLVNEFGSIWFSFKANPETVTKWRLNKRKVYECKSRCLTNFTLLDSAYNLRKEFIFAGIHKDTNSYNAHKTTIPSVILNKFGVFKPGHIATPLRYQF
jgi:hypothetical protein